MFTDIVGYTSLMQKDESLALELLGEHQWLVRQSLTKHGGREVKTIGDAFLVEFPSALEAVRCACEVQSSLHDRNVGCEPKRKVVIRVGVHVGDVLHAEDGKDVFGNSVNIASRIEPLADPGGICVTEQVHDLVKSSRDFEFENLGEHDLKNVEVPIGIFKVILPWETRDRQTSLKQREEMDELQSVQFVDRDQERARLADIVDGVALNLSSVPRIVLIAGEAGVGKTRLVDWLIRTAMLGGAGVARGYCQSDVSIPYFPLSEALSRYLTSHQGHSQAESIDLVNWFGHRRKRVSATIQVQGPARCSRAPSGY